MSMALLVASRFEMHYHTAAYDILLAATSFMGIGFGLTVPALNTFAAAFFPKKVDRAVLVLNALLGLGTALAPVFIALFVGLGIWWATEGWRVRSLRAQRKDQAKFPPAFLGLFRLYPALRHL
jgi:MFS family permease